MNNRQMATLGAISPFIIVIGMAAVYGVYLLIKKQKQKEQANEKA